MRTLAAGPYGVLVEVYGRDGRDGGDYGDGVARCYTAVQRLRSRIGPIVDVVPAERTVLLISTFDEPGRRALREMVTALEAEAAGWTRESPASADDAAAPLVELAVRYDGPDLAEVAASTGLSVAEVVALHTGAEFTVGFTGFAPGFAYLTGLPAALEVPRRAEPRTRVEAGAVGLAGRYSGVYPRSSPGGWQIIGRLADDGVALWDPARVDPALLQPGTRVRFRAVEAGPASNVSAADEDRQAAVSTAKEVGGALRIVRPGLLTTVQDLGRPGFAHLGVPRSGAADCGALRLANRLVGNPEDVAALETTLTGCAVALAEARWIAVTGARTTVTVTTSHGSQAIGQGAAVYAPAGAVVDIGPADSGVRSYLAVAGGVASAVVLGSRSADVLSGLGHERPLRVDDLLPLGTPTALPPDIPGLGIAPLRDPADPAVLRLTPGPRDDWFTEDALTTLASAHFVVAPASNRTALRLDGPPLRRRDEDRELPSEGMVPGAVQVPPDGHPVLFLADHPVTGGYPVIGCVDPADLAAAAQARPGSGIRFRLAARR